MKKTSKQNALIKISNKETVALFGDSITEQNLYAAFVENFLYTHLPEKHLRIYNFGWGGDTAQGGNARFMRDVAPVNPSTVFVNYGMNDGAYTGPDRAVCDWYARCHEALADTIKKTGARQVLLTTSPVDEPGNIPALYNKTLGCFADSVLALGRKRGIPVADIFHPMAEQVRAYRRKNLEFRFCVAPDVVHPNPVGHLIMAYNVLRRIEAPATMQITADRTKIEVSGGVKFSGLKREQGQIEFDMLLPHIPMYVPPEARPALSVVPFQEELNGFFLRVPAWKGAQYCHVVVDGRDAGVYSGADLARGIDLALVETAPWIEQARLVWQLSQQRWSKHFDAWRVLGFETNAALVQMEARDVLIKAQKKYVEGMCAALREVAQPRKHRVRLTECQSPDQFNTVALSPMYPYDPMTQFDEQYPPETDPASVKWETVELTNGFIDLGARFGNPTHCVAYCRMILETRTACKGHLTMGSDDGLSVFLNGMRVLARNVGRPYRMGDDDIDIELKPGRNDLLFRITQHGGLYSFGVRVMIPAGAKVRQVMPAQQ